MTHLVEICPLTRLKGSLKPLHNAGDEAICWLENMATTAFTKRTKNHPSNTPPVRAMTRSRVVFRLKRGMQHFHVHRAVNVLQLQHCSSCPELCSAALYHPTTNCINSTATMLKLMIQYDTVCTTCSHKLMNSQLSLPHGINKNLNEKRTRQTSKHATDIYCFAFNHCFVFNVQ